MWKEDLPNVWSLTVVVLQVEQVQKLVGDFGRDLGKQMGDMVLPPPPEAEHHHNNPNIK